MLPIKCITDTKNNLLNTAELWKHKDFRAPSWLSVDIITLNMELRFVGNNVFVANNNPCVRYYLSMKRKDSERVIIWLCRISSSRADSSSEWCTLAALIRVYLHKLCILIKPWSINSTFKYFAHFQLTVRWPLISWARCSWRLFPYVLRLDKKASEKKLGFHLLPFCPGTQRRRR